MGPVAGRPALLVADSHVGQEAGDETGLVALLEKVRPELFSALFLLGDVFHYLIGSRKFLTPAIERTLAAFDRVRGAGVPIRYVEGNRDFFLRGSFIEPYFTEIALAFAHETPAGRYHLTHGDLINDRDYPYRFWRLVSKNPVSRFAVGFVPRAQARKIVSGVEGRLRRSNFKHKRRLPEELMIEFARRRWAAGDRTVLYGHFHTEWMHEEAAGRVAVVPAWCETGKVGLIDSGGEYRTMDGKDLFGGAGG